MAPWGRPEKTMVSVAGYTSQQTFESTQCRFHQWDLSRFQNNKITLESCWFLGATTPALLNIDQASQSQNVPFYYVLSEHAMGGTGQLMLFLWFVFRFLFLIRLLQKLPSLGIPDPWKNVFLFRNGPDACEVLHASNTLASNISIWSHVLSKLWHSSWFVAIHRGSSPHLRFWLFANRRVAEVPSVKPAPIDIIWYYCVCVSRASLFCFFFWPKLTWSVWKPPQPLRTWCWASCCPSAMHQQICIRCMLHACGSSSLAGFKMNTEYIE